MLQTFDGKGQSKFPMKNTKLHTAILAVIFAAGFMCCRKPKAQLILLRVFVIHREDYVKCRALALFAFKPDIAAMRLGDLQ